MFDSPILQGAPRGIALETGKRTPIPNEVAPEPSQVNRERYNLLRAKHGQNWEERRSPYGACNCAGLVWAARRTAIYEGSAWDRILSDDGYREIHEGSARVGDLAIYADPDPKVGFLHVGLVVSFDPVLTGSLNKVPRVLSKLSDFSGEIAHRAPDIMALYKSPLNAQIRYWTDRPL